MSLTDLDSGGTPATSHSALASADDFPSFSNARSTHAELQGLVEHLSEKVSSLVAAQDREFLSVYRLHMHGVQRELETARMEALAAEEMLKDDKTVAALQAEHTWFREECARLDTLTANMSKDLQYLKSRKAAVDAQVRAMSRQLKQLRRDTKRMELQHKTLQQNQKAQGQQLPQTSYHTDESAHEHQHRSYRSNWHRATSNKIMAKQRQHRAREVDMESLEAEWQQLQASRSTGEEVLENCVREEAEFVLERKNQSIQPSRKGEPLYLLTGVSGLGFSHFTESDRIEVLRSFLSQPGVLDRVVGYLHEEYHFPTSDPVPS